MARRREWREATVRRDRDGLLARTDVKGIEDGVDREGTKRLLEKGRLDAVEQGRLRAVLTGAIWVGPRLERAKVLPTSVCPYCTTGLTETDYHAWWVCPAWDKIRKVLVILPTSVWS